MYLLKNQSMRNKIIIFDDLYEHIELIKGEIFREFHSLIESNELLIYPNDINEFDDLICHLELLFCDDTDKIETALTYFTDQFNADNLVFIIDYEFNNRDNFDGIRIFENINTKFSYAIAIFFTAKGANEINKMRIKVNTLEGKIPIVKKPFFRGINGKLDINLKVLKEENIIDMLRENIAYANKHKRL